ncbi:MAG: GGDEF domain-containing protein [Treponema sp.]|nr:GGDEF domain-containing protein [Treponema sp.]
MNLNSDKIKNSIANALVTIFILTGIFVIFMGQGSQRVKLITREPKSFDKGWYYYTNYDEKTFIPALPAKIPTQNGTVNIYHRLRAFEDGNTTLCFYSEHQDVTIRINHKVIYSFNTHTKPKSIISYRPVYNVVHLPEIFTDSILSIETSSDIESCKGVQKRIMLGDSSQIFFSLIAEHIDSFLLGVLFIVSSIFLLCTNHLFTGANRKDYTLLHLALLTLCIGFWQLDDSTLLMFFTGNLPVLWCFKYLTQLFLPVFCYFFLKSIIEKPKSRFMGVIFWAIVLVVVVQFILQITGICALTDSIFASHFIYAATCIYTVVTLFREEWLKDSKLKYLLVFSMIFSVIIFIFTAFSLMNKQFFNSVMSWGLAVTFVAMILIAYQKELKLFESINKAETYKKLAFVDIATGVNNKTAWFTLVDNFNENTRVQGEYCLIVFDMNNLKKLNDNYGHITGDRVIKSFCDCLVKVVGDKGQIYRIGGDEFVCVCAGIYRENIVTILHYFDEEVAKQPESEYKFSAAYGYEFFTPKSSADFKTALDKADEKMYASKVAMKAARE